jgi:hypothetical protein
MKSILISTLLALGLATPQAFASRAETADVATDLRQDLTQLSGAARNVAENAESNGNQVRAQRFRAVARESNDLAQDVRQYIIRPLQQGASQAQLRANFRYVNENQLENALQQINQMPENVAQRVRSVRTGFRQLQRALNDNWGGGGGGNWVADCRVVLETIWGADLQDFYGRARGPTQQAAVRAAREEGLNQCNYQREGLLTRCVVDQNNCSAERRN